MKIPVKRYMRDMKEEFGTRSSKAGSYSFFLTEIVLAIIVTVNLALSFLPDSYVQEDLTANQLYSISSQSKVLLGTVEEDITLYWIVASGEEDEYIEKLLHNYEDYSSRVTVEKKDPDLDPEFTNSYTDETVYNNSVIVECGDKYRYISYEDIGRTRPGGTRGGGADGRLFGRPGERQPKHRVSFPLKRGIGSGGCGVHPDQCALHRYFRDRA